jgi:hypothetical protein
MERIVMRKPVGMIIVFSVLVLASAATWADAISFKFALDKECATSAGVYAPDGQMVRTLWS